MLANKFNIVTLNAGTSSLGINIGVHMQILHVLEIQFAAHFPHHRQPNQKFFFSIYLSDKRIEGSKYQKIPMLTAMIYGTCTGCEFEVSGQSLDELDKKFNHHFVICGHDAYFYREKNLEKIRKIT